MKKIIYSILAVAAVFAVSSCEKNLDIPQKGVVTPGEFYSSDADAEAVLTNMYTSCFGGHGIAGSEGIYNNQLMVLNYSSDDILAAGGDANDHLDFRIFDEFRYDNASGVLRNLYDGYAQAIYAANVVISNFTDENKDKVAPKHTSDFTAQCVAEARVFRAYMHMMEALIWNTPCIADRTYEYEERPTQASSQKEVLDWVIAECDKAIKSGKLPVRKDASDKDATARMTRGFAQFVAGKAAMFNNDPATARQYLGDLINDGNYSLVDGKDFWKLTHAAGDGNSEVLFAPNFHEEPALTNGSGGWGQGAPIQRGRWMIADVLCWRTDALASAPSVVNTLPFAGGGWNGGAITEAFAKKFEAHDGKSPRRLATFLNEEEFLYEMDWSGSSANDGSIDAKKKDDKRGISSVNGVYSHSKYFEWKRMAFNSVPRLLAGAEASSLIPDSFGLGPNSNQSNLCMARYAEALLLYAEACIGSDKAAEGKAALNAVQKRAGVPETELTFENVMDEKQFELWFEGCRFHDLVRWSAQGKVNLDEIFNKSGIHENVPIVKDKFFPVNDGVPSNPEHELTVSYVKAIYNPFEVGKHEYLPFPRDVKTVNPNIQDVLGWK